MWIRATTQLSENVFQVTTSVSSHLIGLGTKAALVDATITATGPTLLESIESQLRDTPIEIVFISHAHFDHVGALPLLRERFPDLQVYASPQTAELLANSEHRQELYQQNAACCSAFQVEMTVEPAAWEEALRVDQIVRDGDTVPLGDGVEVKVIGTPGHTEDSLSYLIRPDAALCGGEALGGYRGRGKYTCCFSHSFSQYIASLDRLSKLEIMMIALPHSGTLSGELALRYLAEIREEAQRLQQMIQTRLTDGEIIDEIASSLYPEWIADSIAPEGPFTQTVRERLLEMIKAVAENR